MVRTAAGARTGGGKNPKGNATVGNYVKPFSTGSKSKARGFRLTSSGPTKKEKPLWQKPITTFMKTDAKYGEPKDTEEQEDSLDTSIDTELKAPDWQKPIPEFLTSESTKDIEPKPEDKTTLVETDAKEKKKAQKRSADKMDDKTDIGKEKDEETEIENIDGNQEIESADKIDDGAEKEKIDENPSKRIKTDTNYDYHKFEYFEAL